MKAISRRTALQILVGAGAMLGLGAGCALRSPDSGGGGGMMGSNGGMMGSATSADMNTYMDMFDRHSQIRRTVEQIQGGVRTTTESDDPSLTTQLQAHVSSMYEHLAQGQEVTCMSGSLPVLFRNTKGYHRQLTFTSKGVVVTETSTDPMLVKAIRAHSQEVTGFVQEGMPAMMQGMMS